MIADVVSAAPTVKHLFSDIVGLPSNIWRQSDVPVQERPGGELPTIHETARFFKSRAVN